MLRKTQSQPKSHTEAYNAFRPNLYKLRYFLETTEEWYAKQVRILGRQVRAARKDLRPLKIRRIDEFFEKSRLSKADEEWVAELIEKVPDLKVYDLTDINIFLPMEMEMFRQFPELIRILGLTYLVTIFEGYLVDVVREILLAHPDALKSKRQLTAEEVLTLGGQKQIISCLAEKEAEELLYRSFPDVIKYFDDKFNIDLSTSGVSVEKITEILATRNIHIHNKGRVNQRFNQLVKGSTLKIGTYKSITREYLMDSISSIETLTRFIDTQTKTKHLAS